MLGMNKSLLPYQQQLPVPATGSLAAYISWAQQIPMLSAEEEATLTHQLFYEGDLKAAKKLIFAHLRFVVQVARGFSGYGLSQADLIQEGNIGLLKAVKRFNPEAGVRLVTFAVHWIKSEMHEYIIRNWRIVKIATTKAQRKLFFNLRKMGKRLGWQSNDEIKHVADTLKVSEAEVRHMEMRMRSYDESIETPTVTNDACTIRPGENYYLEDKVSDPAHLFESFDLYANQSTQLRLGLASLDERSRNILEHRWLGENKLTLDQLAKKHGVSLERIRQLEKSALASLRVLIDR